MAKAKAVEVEKQYLVEFFLSSGQTIAISASDLQVGIVPERDEDDNPNEDAGELTGFKIESLESEKLAYLYVRVPEVNAIRATERGV